VAGFSGQGVTLREKLRQLAVEAGQCSLTMGDGLQRIAAGVNGYGIPLLLLSLPGALPMPAVGLNTPLGVVVMLLGLQMFIGRSTVWLPHWFTRIELRADWVQRSAHLGERFLPRLEYFVKPRINWLKYRSGVSLLGLIVVLLGFLMLLPIPGTNTLPAIVLLVLSMGLIESDGLLTLLAALVALALAVLYAEAIYLLITWFTG
jgi:hypothetical protein